MRETSATVIARSFALLEAIVRDGGSSSVAALARSTGVPVASAHRHVEALVQSDLLVSSGYARHLPGPRLRALLATISDRRILTSAAEPIIKKLARQNRCVAQLGIYENDMVTYLVKAGESADALFTQVGMQLEAYCSGIGKVLLAHLPPQDRANYLAAGPFIALTGQTITDPDRLKEELEHVAVNGHAVDNEEVITGLQCLAVPVRNGRGEVIAAISASRAAAPAWDKWRERSLPLLRAAAAAIAERGV